MLQDLHTGTRPEEDRATRMKRAVIGAIAAALALIVVGSMDQVTGWKISVLLFYLIPVCIAATWVGPWGGVVASFAATATWFGIAVTDTERHSQIDLQTTVWNAVMRLGVFLVVVLLIALIHRYRAELDKLRNSLPW